MDEASEREAFEAWSKANGCGDDLRYKTSCDEYVNLMTHSAWQAWKGRAAVPVVQPPEFQEVSWGVDSTMRPCKGMAVSEYAFREWAKANGIALVAPLARQEPKPDSVYPVQPSSEAATAQPSDAARDVIRDLLARHATLIEEGNEHAYFELAYTRQTGWMAWITDRPARGEPGTAEYARSRKVVARGQGDTPDEACADAIFAMQQASTPVQVDGGTGDLSAVDRITDANRHGEAWPDGAAAQPSGSEALRTIGAAGPLGDPEVTEPFWCHEQSHDRPRCEAQCAECAEDGVPVSQESNVVETLRLARLALRNATAPVGNHSARMLIGEALLALDRAIAGVAPVEAPNNVAVSLRNANPARSQEDGYCAASGVQPLKGKSHE